MSVDMDNKTKMAPRKATAAPATAERLTLAAGLPRSTEWQHLARYQFAATRVAGKDVLDIACGTGYGSKMMREAGARRVTGIDFSSVAVEQARSATRDLTHIEFQQGDAQDLAAIGDGVFDTVVSFETIEHLVDDRAYLREMRRVLKPGGVFIVSTPDGRLESTLYGLNGRPMNRHHIREYRRQEFLDLLDEQFAVEEIHGQVYVHPLLVPWPVQVLIKGVCRLGRPIGGAKLKERLYDIGSGCELQKSSPGRGYLAKYLIAVCRPKT